MPHRLFDFELSLPPRLRPAFRGATFILGMGSGTIGKLFVLVLLATLVFLAGPGPGLLLFAELLGVALVSGAVGGTIHGLSAPLERWGRTGTWLQWTLAMFAYMTTFAFLAPAGPFTLGDYAFYPVAGLVSALGAVCLLILDARRPGRLSNRKRRVQQGRDQMWAAADRVRRRRDSRLAEAADRSP